MSRNPAIRARPERFGEILQAEQLAVYFIYFEDLLGEIGFTAAIAASAFLQDYFGAWCPYSDEYIPQIFQRVEIETRRKYEMMSEIYNAQYDPLVNYDRSETESSTRTPNLTRAKSGQTAGNELRETLKKQIEHRADKAIPAEGETEWTETTNHNVAPYDSDTLRTSDQDVRKESGYREIETKYEGEDPDTDSTSRTVSESSITTETGTDNTVRRLTVSGNIGTVTAQDMANQQLDLSQRMYIFRELERDIAQKLFIQVW